MASRVQVVPIDPDELRLKKNVLLGYTDLIAAGSRALLGIDMRMEYFEMEVPEMRGHMPACERHRKLKLMEQEFQPLQVLNCKYEEFSVVVVNTLVPGRKCHYVANRILELCVQSAVERIILLSVMRMDMSTEQQKQLFENCYLSSPVSSLPALPEHTLIIDPFMSTLLQLIRIEGIPLNVLTIPGYRGTKGKANLDDGSKQAIAKFQDIISEHTRLKFDREASFNMLYKGKNDGNVATMMYM